MINKWQDCYNNDSPVIFLLKGEIIMQIKQYPCGPIGANCYLVETDTSSVIIDPCVPLPVLPAIMKPVKAIIITHCHYDHISCLEEIRMAAQAPVYSHPLEFPAFSDVVKNVSTLFMMDNKYPVPDHGVTDLETLILDEETTLQFLHTPGHTMGSISILLMVKGRDTALFTGDTLFHGSAGRTDLGGNPVLLDKSLNRLRRFGDEIIVYSGHGDQSTIGEEKRTNPFFIPK